MGTHLCRRQYGPPVGFAALHGSVICDRRRDRRAAVALGRSVIARRYSPAVSAHLGSILPNEEPEFLVSVTPIRPAASSPAEAPRFVPVPLLTGEQIPLPDGA